MTNSDDGSVVLSRESVVKLREALENLIYEAVDGQGWDQYMGSEAWSTIVEARAALALLPEVKP